MRDTSVTQSGATGRSLAAALGAAREELRADIARGAGGRTALERYSIGPTRCYGSCLPRRRRRRYR